MTTAAVTPPRNRTSWPLLAALALAVLLLAAGIIVGLQPVHTDPTYFGVVQSCGTNYAIHTDRVATFTTATDPRVAALPFVQRALMDVNSQLECHQRQQPVLPWVLTIVGALGALAAGALLLVRRGGADHTAQRSAW